MLQSGWYWREKLDAYHSRGLKGCRLKVDRETDKSWHLPNYASLYRSLKFLIKRTLQVSGRTYRSILLWMLKIWFLSTVYFLGIHSYVIGKNITKTKMDANLSFCGPCCVSCGLVRWWCTANTIYYIINMAINTLNWVHTVVWVVSEMWTVTRRKIKLTLECFHTNVLDVKVITLIFWTKLSQ